MGNTKSSRFNRIDWLATGPFAPHIDAYKQYLTERGYAANTFSNCMRSIAHFAQWTRSRRLRVRRIDESVVAEFLDRHLPECRCTGSCCRDRGDLSAALGHLLVVLRTRGIVAPPTSAREGSQAAIGSSLAHHGCRGSCLASSEPDTTWRDTLAA